MQRIEDLNLHVIDREWAADCQQEDLSRIAREDGVFPIIVDEWQGHIASPEATGIERDDMLSMLCSIAINHGVHPQEAFSICVKAELEAIFNLSAD